MVCGAVASIVGLAATIWFVLIPLWLNSSDGKAPTASTSESPATPTSTPTPTPFSTLAPPTPASPFSSTIPASLKHLLASANRSRWSENHATTMRDVAEHAVWLGYYEIAIKAGDGIRWSAEKSETLKFVAICAAKEGLFGVANKAARRIPWSEPHDDTIAEITGIAIRHQREPPEPNMARERLATDCNS